MKVIQEQVVCRSGPSYKDSKREKPFNLVKIVFYYESDKNDKLCLDELIQKGNDLATRVNPGAANKAAFSRNEHRIKNNCVAGVLAEYAWKLYLNIDKEIVLETTLEDISSQIDLKIISNSKKLEVRSSFPRKGIDFAICHPVHQFDIIGPYNNNYKPDEIQKDFYIRALFPFESSLIMDKIRQDDFAVYLTGGVTWDMMADNDIAIIKNFIAQDEIDATKLTAESSYRVVPFSNSLDTLEISEIIKRA